MKKKKKELLRLVVDPLDGEYVNKDINPSDYILRMTITTPYQLTQIHLFCVINDIIKNNNEINDEVTITDIKTEPEPATVQETPVTLTEILTRQNDVEDVYIDDENILQETYKTIFTDNLTLPAPKPEVDNNVT